MANASRVGDSTRCIELGVPIIRQIAQGSSNVSIEGRPAARLGDATTHPCVVAGGSSSVFINGRPAARLGDGVSCGGVIIGGATTVSIGG